MKYGQCRRAGQTARWVMMVGVSLSIATGDPDAGGQVRCDGGPSWVSRPVTDLALRLAVVRAGLHGRGAAADVAVRARATAWLPRLGMSVHRGLGVSASVPIGLGTSAREAESEALSFSVSLSIDLDRVGWSPIELEVERMEVQRSERRRALEREIADLLVQLELARLRGDRCAPTAPGQPLAGSPPQDPTLLRTQISLETLCGVGLEELRRRSLR
jgi:hypothetical protein